MSQSLGTFLNPRVAYVQSDSTDPGFQLWARQIVVALNTQTPPCSYFSYTTPNSNVTAPRGTIGNNLNSAVSVHWVKQTGSGNTGWAATA